MMPQSGNVFSPIKDFLLGGAFGSKASQQREERLGEGAIAGGKEYLGEGSGVRPRASARPPAGIYIG